MIDQPIAVTVWKWKSPTAGGPVFSADYVNRMAAMLRRHLHMPHELFCITDDRAGIDPAVQIVALPETLRDTPRCRRRMRQFDFDFAKQFGPRILAIDLDMVIVGDITPLVRRPEPLVLFKIGYADVFSGSILLMTPAALHGLWLEYAADPEGYPKTAWPRGVGSDQAMLNHYVKSFAGSVPHWTERDGLITFFGSGYERFERYGVGPSRPNLPAGARIVVLGSADLHVLEEPERYPWVKAHWTPQGSMSRAS